jgi:hypothetical protein
VQPVPENPQILVRRRVTNEVLGEFSGLKSSPTDEYGNTRGTLVKVQDLAGKWIPSLVPLTEIKLSY